MVKGPSLGFSPLKIFGGADHPMRFFYPQRDCWFPWSWLYPTNWMVYYNGKSWNILLKWMIIHGNYYIGQSISAWWCNFTILKNHGLMGRMTSHILWKINHVWNHQPAIGFNGKLGHIMGELGSWMIMGIFYHFWLLLVTLPLYSLGKNITQAIHHFCLVESSSHLDIFREICPW